MKQRSIIGSLARRMALGMLCLWLAVTALLTTLVAGDIRAQSAPVYAEALERAMEELRSRSGEEGLTAEKLDFSLPECAFVPAGSLPLTRQRQIPLWKGTLALIPRGNIMKGEGFDLTGAVMGNVGLTIVEGKLAIGNNVGDVGNSSGNMTNSSQKGFFLTFWQDPLRKGSFPSREFSGDYEGEKPRSAFPVVVTAPARMTPEPCWRRSEPWGCSICCPSCSSSWWGPPCGSACAGAWSILWGSWSAPWGRSPCR